MLIGYFKEDSSSSKVLRNDRWRRISLVAAHSGKRLLSEPTAGTQPCRREPLLVPEHGYSERGRAFARQVRRMFV
jgi:hypothetical protein